MTMKEKVKISVVIPVHNTGEYLDRCLNSVCGQTLSEIEIICIDDGSEDDSASILKKYAETDERVIVFSQARLGVSSARNRGINESHAEYIFFVDSDDYLAEDALEKVYSVMSASDLDIVIFQSMAFTDNSEYKRRAENITKYLSFKEDYPGVYTGKDLLVKFYDNSNYIVNVWNKCYRSSLIKDNNIGFIEGIIHEDVSFSFECMVMASRVMCINDVLYFYRQRDESITTTKTSFENVYGRYICAKRIYSRLKEMDDAAFVEKQMKYMESRLLKNARLLYTELEVGEKEKTKLLPIAERVDFSNLIADPGTYIKKNIDQERKIRKLSTELEKIKGSRLYRILVVIRKAFHLFKK